MRIMPGSSTRMSGYRSSPKARDLHWSCQRCGTEVDLQDTNKDEKVTAVFVMESASPVVHNAIIGRIISGIGLCPTFPIADLVLTVRRLHSRGTQRQVPPSGINVLNMDSPKPIIMSKSRHYNCQLLRIVGCLGLTKRIVGTEYSKFSAEPIKSDPNAKCLVKFGDTENWLD